MSLINIFLASILSQNIILTKFLGICPFISATNREKNAIQMGASVTLVVTISSIITYLIYYYVLVPTNTIFLRTIMFILVITVTTALLDMWLKRYSNIHQTLGLYLPFLITNCAILGTTLLVIDNSYTFLETLVFSFGSSIGFTLVIYIFASIRERLETSDISSSFKGIPIALLTAAIMSLVFARFI